MSDVMQAEEPDWEREFYGILSTWDQAEMKDMVVAIRKDTFDAANGPQVGTTAAGNTAMLLVFTPATAKMVLDAWTEWHDHKCEPAHTALMGFLVHQMMLLQMYSPTFPEDVQALSFFDHTDDGVDVPDYEDDDDA